MDRLPPSRCGLCRFWDTSFPEGAGECHRNAPVAAAASTNEWLSRLHRIFYRDKFEFREPHNYAVFPVTEHNQWCGQFDRRSDAPAL